MEIKFSNVDDCTSFSISTKTLNRSQKTTSTMTAPIKYDEKNIETRKPNKEIAIQCDNFNSSSKAKEFDKNKLAGFLRSRMPLFENTFREQKEIENSTGKLSKIEDV